MIGQHAKERPISMKLVVDFGPIHGNAYTLAVVLSALVYDTITNNNNNKDLFKVQYPMYIKIRVQWTYNDIHNNHSRYTL